MKKIKVEINTGNILLAEPFMLEDDCFKKSVVLLCEHSADAGTLGFVLNKPLDIPINDLIIDFPEIESKVFYGGPVATDTIHYIHNVGDSLDGSVKVCDGIWWGGDFEQLKFKIRAGLIEEDNIRFFIGYSGWEAGQLQREMQSNTWVISNMKKEYAFGMDANDVWEQSMADKGSTFFILSQVPTGKGIMS